MTVIKCTAIISANLIKATAKVSAISKVYVTAKLVTEMAGGSVDIIDQNAVVIATVPAPGTYQVEVLNEIVDEPDFNTTTIIDPL